MDLFTDEPNIPIIIGSEFVGLRVFARNCPSREIAFLEEKTDNNSTTLILNLDPLDLFPKPSVTLNGNEKCRHVRIEIEYILINPEIPNLDVNNLKEIIWDKLFPKKKSTVLLIGEIQPELYLTLPLGWRCREREKGKDFFKKLFHSRKNTEGYSVGMVCYINETSEVNSAIPLTPKVKTHNVLFNKPFIKINEGKRTYNYSIDADNFLTLKELISESKENTKNHNVDVTFNFTYISKISTAVGIISLIPYIFLVVSTLILGNWFLTLGFNTISGINTNFIISYLILILSFSFFYYSLIKEGFNIPHKYFHMLIFCYSVMVIIGIILMEICQNYQAILSFLIQYFLSNFVNTIIK